MIHRTEELNLLKGENVLNISFEKKRHCAFVLLSEKTWTKQL